MSTARSGPERAVLSDNGSGAGSGRRRRWLAPTVLVALLTVVALLSLSASAVRDRPGRLSGREVALPGVARTPPMGWNTWNSYGCAIDADIVRRAADDLVSTGMRDAGYRYVVVDDCWFDPRRTKTGALQADPDRFPGGIPALADYVHSRGLKFGIYESPGERTCAQLGGSYPGRTGSHGHEVQDAATFASWGVDYLKYDWCSTDSDLGAQVADFSRMRDALRATGRPIVYSINPNSGISGTPPGTLYDWSGIATLWRTTNDVYPGWALGSGSGGGQGIREILDTSSRLSSRGGPDHWLDPDMLEVGVPGVAHTPYPGLTVAEQRTQFGMWALLAAPLMAGNPLSYPGTATRDLLTDPEVIAVDQDPLGATATAVAGSGGKVWRRTMSDGSVAVALRNSGDSDTVISFTPADLGLRVADHYVAQNLWTGQSTAADGTVGSRVAAHDTLLLRIRPGSPD